MKEKIATQMISCDLLDPHPDSPPECDILKWYLWHIFGSDGIQWKMGRTWMKLGNWRIPNGYQNKRAPKRPIFWVRKISPKFSCIKFFQIWDVPTRIPGHPGHSVSKTTEKGHLHKVFVWDIPTSGSWMSQDREKRVYTTTAGPLFSRSVA